MERYFFNYLAITLKIGVYKSKFSHHFINISLNFTKLQLKKH